ncbi:MAG: hypothetical protein KC493_10650 [Bacteriovoracaceae bacterium]|nr:hypothetical protein [Bacteriovoracaceae bacterium]
MEILITTTRNQPPTASSFHDAARSLGHNVSYLYPESNLETQINQVEQSSKKLIVPLYTALNYCDDDLALLKTSFGGPENHFLNSPESLLKVRGKEKQIKLFSQLGLPVIESLVIEEDPNKKMNELTSLYNKSKKLIIKPFRSNNGIGIQLITEMSKAIELLEEQYKKKDQRYLIQPFIEHAYELRILYHQGKALLAYRKFSNAGSFLNNLSSGATSAKVKTSEIPIDITNNVKSIQQTTGLNYFACDFIVSNDSYWLMEVNTSPGLIKTSALYSKDLAKEVLKHEIK